MPSSVSLDGSFAFVHVPKTGGTSISKTLEDLLEPVGPGIDPHRTLKNLGVQGECFKFAVVRNPWEMCVSWRFWHIRNKDLKGLAEAIEYTRTPLSLGIDEMDFVLRFERLQEDFFLLCDRLKIARRLLCLMNKSEHENYRNYYTEELRAVVAQRFRWEIERFNYEF